MRPDLPTAAAAGADFQSQTGLDCKITRVGSSAPYPIFLPKVFPIQDTFPFRRLRPGHWHGAVFVLLALVVFPGSKVQAFEYLDSLEQGSMAMVFALVYSAASGTVDFAIPGSDGPVLRRLDLETLEVVDERVLTGFPRGTRFLIRHPDADRLYIFLFPASTDLESEPILLELQQSDWEVLRELELSSEGAAASVAPDGTHLYISQQIDGHAGLVKVDLEKFTIVDQLIFQYGSDWIMDMAMDMVMDSSGNALWVGLGEGESAFYPDYSGLFKVDLETFSATPVSTGNSAHVMYPSLALSLDGETLWAYSSERGIFGSGGDATHLVGVNTDTLAIEADIELPNGYRAWKSLALDPDPERDYAYLASWDSGGSWLRVDLGNNELIDQISYSEGYFAFYHRPVFIDDLVWYPGQSRISRLSLKPGVFFQDRFEVAAPED